MIFLDSAATTPVRREVIEAMWPYLTGSFGNPSSHHGLGESAALGLHTARERVAAVLGCLPGEVTFTSGGTEADNLAVKGIALARRAENSELNNVLISAVEHPAVLESALYLERFHGFVVEVIKADGEGLVSVDALDRAVAGGGDSGDSTVALASIMYANNEVGTVAPIAALAHAAAGHGIPLHTDAVQAAGLLPINVAALGVSALSLSGHKVGAPKGIGALYVRAGQRAEPLVHGGGQERGLRSGTENVAFAVALATALELSAAEQEGTARRLSELRDDFIAEVLRRVPSAFLTGHPVERLPSVASFCFPGTSGEAVLLELERRDVFCSSGSACAAGADDPSPVLLAMGIEPAVAQTAVRFSLNHHTTAQELQQAAACIEDSLRALGTLAR